MNGVIVFEGVSFVVDNCKAMGKDRFINAHVDAFWQDRDEATRRKMLAGAWSKINPPKTAK